MSNFYIFFHCTTTTPYNIFIFLKFLIEAWNISVKRVFKEDKIIKEQYIGTLTTRFLCQNFSVSKNFKDLKKSYIHLFKKDFTVKFCSNPCCAKTWSFFFHFLNDKIKSSCHCHFNLQSKSPLKRIQTSEWNSVT